MSEFRICPILLRIGINLKTTEIAKDDVFKQTKSEVPSKLGNRKYKENLINKKQINMEFGGHFTIPQKLKFRMNLRFRHFKKFPKYFMNDAKCITLWKKVLVFA